MSITGKHRWAFILTFETIFLGGLILLMSWFYMHWLIPGFHGPIHWVGMDFVPYWVGVRAMLAGQNPYLAATTNAIQVTMLGGPAVTGSDPMMFVYPALIFLPLLPFALLPLQWAIAVWCAVIFSITLHVIAFLALRWGGYRSWKVGLWGLGLSIGSLPFMAIAALKGQFSLVILGILFLVNRIWKERSITAGGILGLALLKPTMAVMPVISFLVLAVIKRQYRLLIGFLAFSGILFLTSILAIGNWLPDYIHVILQKGNAPILWSLASLQLPWRLAYCSLFAGILIYSFVRLLRPGGEELWISANILTGMALLPMRWIYDLVIGLLVPMGSRNIRGLLGFFVAASLFAPWAFALLEEAFRWQAITLGLPLFWSVVWAVIAFKKPIFKERTQT